MKRTPFKKRNTIIKQGKISKNNAIARQQITEIAEENNINECEIKLPGCLAYYTLAPCHKHPREWYRGDIKLLADYNEWICGCVNCHIKLDNDSKLKQKYFNKLRLQ